MLQVIASLKTNPEEPEALQTYFDTAIPLLERAGAKIRQRIEVGDEIVGKNAPEIMMLVDYPSYEAIDAVFQSAEYKSVIPVRDRAFLKYNVCIVNENQLID